MPVYQPVCNPDGMKLESVMERKITDLKIQKRNSNRVNVYLEGEFAFGLSRITAAWLEIGQILTDEKISELKAADEFEIAYQQAINYLSYRTRSEKEVRENLYKHDFSDEVTQEVLQRLRRLQLVNDHRFAQAWVENRNEFRPRSQRALRVELRQKGINEQVIAEVLQDLDEENLAFQAAARQSRKYAGLTWEAYRPKMVAYLARRGFPYGIAGPVAKRAWTELVSQEKSEK